MGKPSITKLEAEIATLRRNARLDEERIADLVKEVRQLNRDNLELIDRVDRLEDAGEDVLRDRNVGPCNWVEDPRLRALRDAVWPS